uniref:Uncharacterized protein n=1 Tax=Green Sichuan pepper nepovirus satellite TaxID=2851655 RepID=A0A8F3ER64_9VIRU|nr:hypothetical protein [Green Sichuan pepper nepovirus satellite]QWY93782.1 hypothetical protein [Green Sichuan pepper nepovirus satellite]
MNLRTLLLSSPMSLRSKASQTWTGLERIPWIRRLNPIRRRSVLEMFQTSHQTGSEPESVRAYRSRVYPVLI